MNPSRWLLLAFMGLIVLGSLALSLPGMTTNGIAPIDALFTATSAVSLTGLSVLDTEHHFTLAGQVVILLLIQGGAIGIISLASMLLLATRARLSLRYEEALSSAFGLAKPLGRQLTMRRLTFVVARTTLLIELCGALVLTLVWPVETSWPERLWQASFHAVSAFCNAGFALFSANLEGWTGHWGANLVLIGLIVLGGFGFANQLELWHRWRNREFRWRRFSMFLKITLLLNLLLLLGGAVLLVAMEHGRALAGLAWPEKLLAGVFHSASTRTAGFNTVTIGSFTDFSLVIMAFLMFFGGTSGSCAGGVKIGSLAVLFGVVRSFLRNHPNAQLFSRRISPASVQRTIVLLVTAVTFGLLAITILCLTQEKLISHRLAGNDFLSLVFEVISALGTVGLSTGITGELTTGSKLTIIACMFVGKVGPLAFLTAWISRAKPFPYKFPEQNIPVG